jgi:tetratricopeptide (TPR) repeat protein
MSKKRGALHNLADAMSEDILNTPGDDLLYEVEEDYGDPQALAVQFDRIRAQAEREVLWPQAEREVPGMARAAANPACSSIVDFRPPWKIAWIWDHPKSQELRLERLWTFVCNRIAWLGAAAWSQAEREAPGMARAAARPARSSIVDFRPPWKIAWIWNHAKSQELRLERVWTFVGNHTAWLGAAAVLVVLISASAIFRSMSELSEKSDQLVAHGEGQLVAEGKRATLKKEGSDFYRKWSEFGDHDDLLSAVERFKQVVDLTTGERMSLDWADTQNNLGLALMSLGERERGTAQLKEAVAAFREALQERTRERVPFDWADSQNNLGLALGRLGERENGTAQLKEAVAAFREALQERTREQVPLDWADTQNNLGLALMSLGERERGTAQLREGVAAFREALQERTRERVPLDWADTQNNLGLALVSLAEREKGRARLKEGLAALREALKERTRDRVPPPR